MAEDAIRCYLESVLRTGEEIPADVEPATERVAATVHSPAVAGFLS